MIDFLFRNMAQLKEERTEKSGKLKKKMKNRNCFCQFVDWNRLAEIDESLLYANTFAPEVVSISLYKNRKRLFCKWSALNLP